MANDDRVFIPEVPHSTRGASGAPRWLKCAGSIQLAEKLAREGHDVFRSGPAAAEGTAAHTVLSTALEDGSEGWEFGGMEFKVGDWDFIVDDEMASGVQVTIDLVNSILVEYADAKPRVYIEKRIGTVLNDDAWGTPDIIIIIPGVKIVVIDFKYGRGVSVEPTSAQLWYYGYLAVENYVTPEDNITDAELWIAQPRIPHPDGLCRKHTLTVAELEAWFNDELLPGLLATYEPHALLIVGEQCRFCPAKGHCPALKREAFEFNSDIEPSHLTAEEIGEALRKKSAIVQYFERVEREAYNRALHGEPIPGQKLVRKKANRVFKESLTEPNDADPAHPIVLTFDEVVVQVFGDEAFTEPSVKSPAQIEKLEGGKGFVSKWAYVPDMGLTLAPDSDKRVAVKRPMEAYMATMDADPDSPY
jgi:hypothetical protein